MVLTLTRFFRNKEYTLGVITNESGWVCNTLELPYRANQENISCIPAGEYNVIPYKSKKHGDIFLLENVPNRTFIEIHPGNTDKDTNGCILPGGMFGTNRILYSTVSLQKIRTIVENKPFILKVIGLS